MLEPLCYEGVVDKASHRYIATVPEPPMEEDQRIVRSDLEYSITSASEAFGRVVERARPPHDVMAPIRQYRRKLAGPQESELCSVNRERFTDRNQPETHGG